MRVMTRVGPPTLDSDAKATLQGDADAILHKIQRWTLRLVRSGWPSLGQRVSRGSWSVPTVPRPAGCQSHRLDSGTDPGAMAADAALTSAAAVAGGIPHALSEPESKRDKTTSRVVHLENRASVLWLEHAFDLGLGPSRLGRFGAEGGTRTPTPLRAQVPKTCAATVTPLPRKLD